MLRLSLILCLLASGASAEIKTMAEIKAAVQTSAASAECDTCLARQNGKRALRAYLAEKRARDAAEEKETQDD